MSGVTPVSLQKATDFVRDSRLRGGTDLERALEAGLAQCVPGSANNYLVLLTDGSATRGPIVSGKLSAWYAEKWKSLPEASRPKLFVFAVGDDANLPLLRLLTRNDGLLENVLSTEPTEFKLNAFISKMNMNPIGQMGLTVSPQSALDLVYPLQDTSFAGSMASWVGQYKAAQKGVSFDVHGVRDGDAFSIHGSADLPQKSLEHDQLPRLWAKARVDALLEKIEREGEDKASIDEIIRLARKYKFVTPYTSFLAVPRALLRPRVIRPGDPVLRVRTDPIHRLGGCALSFRTDQAAALPGQGRYLADALPCAAGHGRRHAHGPAGAARPQRRRLSRSQDLCDCQQDADSEDHSRPQAVQKGRVDPIARPRFVQHAHIAGATGRRGAGEPALEPG